MIYSRKKQVGFTLLEVLMVVAMLAIVGGAIITSYGGLERIAASGTAAHTIQGTHNAFRVYLTTEQALPNNLESLIAATPTSPTFVAAETDNSATDATAGVLATHLSHSLEDKLSVVEIDPEPLLDAGITKIRYMDLKGNTTAADSELDIKGADGGAADVGSIALIDIPGHAFEVPQSGEGNRGRGYYVNLAAGTLVPFAVWNAGDNGYNNILVGGNTSSVLVALGIGDASSLIGDATFTNLGDAPYKGGMPKNEYNHYIALIDISVEPARFVSVICAQGHFGDAEYAESRGQGGGHDHDH